MSDAQPDVSPPRYEQVGNWKELIRDEQEWLARPDSWGIDRLPEAVRGRKHKLLMAHLHGWLAGFIECAACQPRVRALFSDEDGRYWFDDDAAEGWDVDTHSDGACDASDLRRAVRDCRRGLITQTEMHNKLWDALFDNFYPDRRAVRAGQGRLLVRARHDYERWLALELVGPNPFRPVAFAPEWRTDTAAAIARAMYESRDFSAMPILADALQDAGCDSDAILSHCRDANAVHVRGCWVIDLVLGKS